MGTEIKRRASRRGRTRIDPSFTMMTPELREALKYCKAAETKKEHKTCKKLLELAEKNPKKYREFIKKIG